MVRHARRQAVGGRDAGRRGRARGTRASIRSVAGRERVQRGAGSLARAP